MAASAPPALPAACRTTMPKSHPPSGQPSTDADRVVKITKDIVDMAEFVASRRRSARLPNRKLSVGEYLSSLLRSLVEKDFRQESQLLQEEVKQARNKS
jgi:hypothetical protein